MSLPRSSDKLADKWSNAQFLFDIFLRYWRRNYGSTRKPIWRPLCNYVRRGGKYNYDLHWLDPYSSKDGLDGVSFYVTKYLLKFDDWIDKFKSKLFFNLDESDYKDAWNKFRPRILLSKYFGSPLDPEVSSHIKLGIRFALNNAEAFFPYFVSTVNGSTYPLSPYYAKHHLSVSDQLVFCNRRPDRILTYEDFDDFDKKEKSLSDVRSFLRKHSSAFDYDDIDDINIQTFSDYAESSRLLSQIEDFANAWEDF